MSKFRSEDTEVKFIFTLFANHWHKGNKFVIQIESVIHICPNCQKYFGALYYFGQEQGVEVVTNSSIRNLEDARKILNQQ